MSLPYTHHIYCLRRPIYLLAPQELQRERPTSRYVVICGVHIYFAPPLPSDAFPFYLALLFRMVCFSKLVVSKVKLGFNPFPQFSRSAPDLRTPTSSKPISSITLSSSLTITQLNLPGLRKVGDHEDKDAAGVIYPPTNTESAARASQEFGGSAAIQSLFVESNAEATTPKVLKKRGRKKKNPNPEEVNSSTPGGNDSENRSKFYKSASDRTRTVTAEERERAINAAKTFEPTNPFFRVVLRPSYLYRGCIMYLPSGFAEKYLSGISGFIKLQLGEKQWPVRCLYKAGRAKFSQGWYEFTLENNIGEGDVCVFELLRVQDFVLKCTAFRVTEYA